MHDTSNGGAKMTAAALSTSADNEVKVAPQPIKGKDTQNALSAPRKLHETVSSQIAASAKLPSPNVTMNITGPEPSVAKSPTVKPTPPPATVAEIKVKPDVTPSPPPAAKQTAAVIVNDELQNGAKIRLVYANNHYSAYVRSAASDGEYTDLLQRVIEAATTAAKLTDLPKRNDMVSAPFLGDYYRAIIVKADAIEQPIRVAFLDFGNIESVKFDDLRELSDDLKNAKRFTCRIFFDGIDRETTNPEGLALLKQIELEGKSSFIVHSSSNSQTIGKDSFVKLINTKTKECLNDKLAATAVAAPVEPEPVSQPPVEPKPTPKSPPAALPPTPMKKVRLVPFISWTRN